MRKLLIAVLILSFLLALIACGGNGGNTTTTPSAPQQNQGNATTNLAQEAEDDTAEELEEVQIETGAAVENGNESELEPEPVQVRTIPGNLGFWFYFDGVRYEVGVPFSVFEEDFVSGAMSPLDITLHPGSIWPTLIRLEHSSLTGTRGAPSIHVRLGNPTDEQITARYGVVSVIRLDSDEMYPLNYEFSHGLSFGATREEVEAVMGEADRFRTDLTVVRLELMYGTDEVFYTFGFDRNDTLIRFTMEMAP